MTAPTKGKVQRHLIPGLASPDSASTNARKAATDARKAAQSALRALSDASANLSGAIAVHDANAEAPAAWASEGVSSDQVKSLAADIKAVLDKYMPVSTP